MNKKIKATKKTTEKQRKHLLKAKKSFQKMQEEIAPFIKRREFKYYSTEGQWRDTSSL